MSVTILEQAISLAKKFANSYERIRKNEIENQEVVREALANYAHQAWSGWMIHLFKLSINNPDGSVVIPSHFAMRWKRQMANPYADLPEGEKKSDRKEADRILAIVEQRE